MKCLRIFSTDDGESHFDEVEIPTTSLKVHPNAAAFQSSAKYAASGLRFTNIPAGARHVDWHNVPERVLTVRLNGSAEYETSDGDKRRVEAGEFILFIRNLSRYWARIGQHSTVQSLDYMTCGRK